MTHFQLFHAVQEVGCLHAFFACQLQFYEFEPLVSTSHQERLTIHLQRSYLLTLVARLTSLKDLQHSFFSVGSDEGCPCTRIRTQTAHKVVHLLGRLRPVNLAGLLENLWSRF